MRSSRITAVWTLGVALVAGSCGLLEPATQTEVSGTVYRDGVGVPGVTVTLLAARGSVPPFCCEGVATATTDARGRYTVSGNDEGASDGCAIFAVNSERITPSGDRLYSTDRSTRITGVECGRSQDGFDFNYSSDLWYVGASADVDSLSLALGENLTFSADFEVSATARAGARHADEFADWFWTGSVAWTFDFDPRLLIDVGDYNAYFEPINFIELATQDTGSAQIVASVVGAPFADTVPTTVRPAWWVGEAPTGVAVSPSGDVGFVAVHGRSRLIQINARDLGHSASYGIRGRGPMDVALTPDGRRALVVNELSANVSIIDLPTGQIVTPGVDSEPHAVAITPDGALAYVTNRGDNTVSVIDLTTDTVTHEPEVGSEPIDVAFDPSGTHAYVTEIVTSRVRVIEVATHTPVGEVSVYGRPWGIAITPDGSEALVALTVTDEIIRVDLATLTLAGAIGVGDHPIEIAITPDGQQAYVTNRDSNDVSVIDLASGTVITAIPVGPGPHGIAIAPDGSRAFVTHRGAADYSVIDLATGTVVW